MYWPWFFQGTTAPVDGSVWPPHGQAAATAACAFARELASQVLGVALAEAAVAMPTRAVRDRVTIQVLLFTRSPLLGGFS
jgi:hypothetical protein